MRGSAWNEVDHTVDHISSFYFYALFYYVIYRILIFQMSLLSDWTSIHVLHNIQIQSPEVYIPQITPVFFPSRQFLVQVFFP